MPENINSLQAQIAKGEGTNLEFKETLFFNIHFGKEDVNVTTASLKGIVAFLNTNGGTLLIGVSDRGDIKGLERDYQFCKKAKQNNDGFELKFRDILGSRLKPYPYDMISICFNETPTGSVCKVEVAASHSEIHLDNDIYVRDGNRNLKLEGPSLSAWIKKRSGLNVFGQTGVPINKKHSRAGEISESSGIDENLLNLVATLKPTTSAQYPWLVKQGEKKIKLTDDDLMYFGKFSAICMKQLRYLPPEVGKDKWRNLIVGKVNKIINDSPEIIDDVDVDNLCQTFLGGIHACIKAGIAPTKKMLIDRRPRLKNISTNQWERIVQTLMERGELVVDNSGRKVVYRIP